MNSKKQLKNSTAYILLGLIIALQLARIIFTFTVEKTGRHSDEIWGYGLANSYYKPYLFMTNDEETDTYANEWVDSQVFADYITVGEEDRFAYDSVLSNMKIDSHPPLFYLALHTVSSIFQGTYSLWYGFAIGLVCFIILEIYIFKLGRFLTKSNLWGLLLVAFYGFSIGALNTYIFVRQYSMVTMFAGMLIYYHARVLFAKEKKELRNSLIMLAVSTAGGCLTHYYFLVYAFMHAAVFFVWFALKKQGKKLLSYSLVMLGSVLVTFTISGAGEMLGLTGGPDLSGGQEVEKYLIAGSGIFSALLGMVSSVTDILYDPFFDKSFNTILDCVLYDLFGIDIDPALPYWLIHGALIVGLIGLFFLLAAWAIAANSKDYEGRLYKGSVKLVGQLKKINAFQLLILAYTLAVAFEHYIVIGFSSPMIMGIHTNRYIFMTYPAICLIFMLVTKKLVESIMDFAKQRKEKNSDNIQKKEEVLGGNGVIVVTATIMLALGILNNICSESTYLFKRVENPVMLEEAVKGRDVIMSLSDHWLMVCYSEIMMGANNVFITDNANEYDYAEEMADYTTDEALLIIDISNHQTTAALKNNVGEGEVTIEMLEDCYLDYYEEVFEGKTLKRAIWDNVFMRNIVVYRIMD